MTISASCWRRCAIVDTDTLPDMDRLSSARWLTASRTMQHLANEDRHVYAVLAADPRPDVAALGQRFQDENREAMAAYADHIKRWTPDRIRTGWADYRTGTLRLIDGMVRSIAREERDLFPTVRVARAGNGPARRSGVNWAREAFAIKDSIAGAHATT